MYVGGAYGNAGRNTCMEVELLGIKRLLNAPPLVSDSEQPGHRAFLLLHVCPFVEGNYFCASASCCLVLLSI